MSIRTDPLDELVIPDGTTVEEHDLVTSGDVFVGGQSDVGFGVRGNNVVAGERVRFGGDIEAEGDCRLDMWCDVDGNVLVGEDAYLGERVHVGGQLVVAGDLDIGDDVDIERGFEANGWIVIRNPMPTIVFLFVYLGQLLRIGDEEAAEEVVSEVLDDGEREYDPVVVPRSARVNDDAWRVSTPARIGEDCRLHGNIRATSIEVGRNSEIFGSLRAKRDVSVEPGTVIHGDLTTRRGTVRIAATAHVRGDISCNDLLLHDDADVDGAIRARGEMTFVGGEAEAEEVEGGDAEAEDVEVEDVEAEDVEGGDAEAEDVEAEDVEETAEGGETGRGSGTGKPAGEGRTDESTVEADVAGADATDVTGADATDEADSRATTPVIVRIDEAVGEGSSGHGNGELITEAEK